MHERAFIYRILADDFDAKIGHVAGHYITKATFFAKIRAENS